MGLSMSVSESQTHRIKETVVLPESKDKSIVSAIKIVNLEESETVDPTYNLHVPPPKRVMRKSEMRSKSRLGK